MTRDEVIAANDELRTTFRGGRVLMTRSVYEMDAQLRGRALVRLTMVQQFADDSLHESGTFVFAGYTFAWVIEEFAGERTLTLGVASDFFGYD